MAVIAVYNIKGGVGKTAASVNLAYLSAGSGKKTLLCDMDPQGSASYYFRIKSAKKFTANKFLKGGGSLPVTSGEPIIPILTCCRRISPTVIWIWPWMILKNPPRGSIKLSSR